MTTNVLNTIYCFAENAGKNLTGHKDASSLLANILSPVMISRINCRLLANEKRDGVSVKARLTIKPIKSFFSYPVSINRHFTMMLLVGN